MRKPEMLPPLEDHLLRACTARPGDIPRILDADEILKNLSPPISPDELLDRKGLFFLAQVAEYLPLNKREVIRHARFLGREAYRVMGLVHLVSRWFVRMKVFAPYYRAHPELRLRRVPRDRETSALRDDTGIYRLSEITPRLPIDPKRLRHRVRRDPDQARKEMGIWKEPKLDTYLVDMTVFGSWFAESERNTDA